MLAQRQQIVQRLQHIQMLQAQGLPIPPDQVQFLSMLHQYQQQRQQQQGIYTAAPAPAPIPGVFSGSVINQSFAGIIPPVQQPYQQQGVPPMGPMTTASGGMISLPGAPGVPAAFNQNVEASGPTPALGAPYQQQEDLGEALLAQWGGNGKRIQPTSKRVPAPP